MEKRKKITIKKLGDLVMQQAKEKGFGINCNEVNVGEKIALIHSEISEAYEAYRHNNIDGKDGFKEELGDALQRILHLCCVLDIDIEKEVLKKIDRNKNRKWNWDRMNEKHS